MEINAGGRSCVKTATKGFKGNKRLIALVKEFIKRFSRGK